VPLSRKLLDCFVSKCVFWLVHFLAIWVVSILLLHSNTSRPSVRLHSLTRQADCGSIKGAGVPVEDGTEHCSEYATHLITANVKKLSHDDSNSYNFSWVPMSCQNPFLTCKAVARYLCVS